MTTITDEYMRQMLTRTRQYSMVILRPGPNRHIAEAPKIIWEHGRRNFELRANGMLLIVCPVADGSDVAGVGIFNTSIEDTAKLMEEDPAVKAGVLIYETHVSRSFPEDSLSGGSITA